MKTSLLTIFLVLFSAVLFASDFDGKWKTTIQTDMGEMSFTMDYKVDGETVSGTLSSDMGDLPFSGGKVSGNQIEYTLDIQGMKITHKGTLDGDKINVKSSGDYGESEFVLTRLDEE